jgi:asparagine synthase (glutamine-hydrolysing)
MCGICGYVDRDAATPSGTLEGMNALLSHRGPDDEGSYRHGSVSMAMRRLAVIDLKSGQQPITDETGTTWVVLNGEIYNYRELREDLVARGHLFVTQSDTEVLVHLYEEEGEAFVAKLMGMFAFALHDRRRRRLVLARDRFGEKPLYYFASEGLFAFSSEIPSLLAHPRVERVVDLEGLRYYLATGMVPTPLTLLRGVRSLTPGHVLSVGVDGVATSRPYFRIEYRPDPGLRDPDRAARRVGEALANAVRRQLVADVPVGAFLSGGIDSSSVVAIARGLKPDPIRTFTVRFPGADYDEGEVAAAVARHLRTRHVEHRVERQGFVEEDFWRVLDHVGLPFIDTSAIPTSKVSELARRDVTVCLSGDGGDEMFAGYTIFGLARRMRSASRLPRPLLEGARRVFSLTSGVPWLPGGVRFRQLRRGLEVVRLPDRMQVFALQQIFGSEEVEALCQNGMAPSLILPLDNTMTEETAGTERWSFMRRMMLSRTRFNLEADMLVKVDRMSMAHSLEVRAPFLDPEVADVAWSLPDDLLLRDGVGKWIVRRAVSSLLPEEVFRHPKQGFAIPLHRYQNDLYRSLVREVLLAPQALHRLFSHTALERLLSFSLEQQSDNARLSVFRASHQAWAMAQLFGWADRFHVSLP